MRVTQGPRPQAGYKRRIFVKYQTQGIYETSWVNPSLGNLYYKYTIHIIISLDNQFDLHLFWKIFLSKMFINRLKFRYSLGGQASNLILRADFFLPKMLFLSYVNADTIGKYLKFFSLIKNFCLKVQYWQRLEICLRSKFSRNFTGILPQFY